MMIREMPPRVTAERPGSDGGKAVSAPAPARGQRATAFVNGDAIEPISNGLILSMTRDEVRSRFGVPPRRAGFPSCDMAFEDFRVDTCYGGKHVSRMYLTSPRVRLNSGIGVGSSRAEVARAFGNPDGGAGGPYKIAFQYSGDRVSTVKIDYNPEPPQAAGARAPSSNLNLCAPNCGYGYGAGQSAPTLYNPNTNYSPYGN